LLLSALNVKYRDFRYVVPFLIQIGLFVSPVAFSADSLPERWRGWYALNPMVGIIEGFRWTILGDRVAIDQLSIALAAVTTIAMAIIGIVYFRRTERSFADVV
jgi:lipopolysaccharide transport system permease protein